MRVSYGHLSDALERLIMARGVPTNYKKPVHGFVCGMAKKVPRKGVWLQLGEKTRNPYYGKKMLRCSAKEYRLPVSGLAGATPEGGEK